MVGGRSVQYQKSHDVPKIPRDVETDVQAATLYPIAGFEPEHAQPLGPESQCDASPGAATPGGQCQRFGGPTAGHIRGEGDRAGRSRGPCAQANKGERRAQLEVHQTDATAAPFAKVVTQERAAATEDECAMERQIARGDPELDAGQEPARSERYEQMSGAAPPSEVLAELHGRFSGDVVPNRESLAPAADRERSRREVFSADGRIGAVLARRRRRADGERRDVLSREHDAPLA